MLTLTRQRRINSARCALTNSESLIPLMPGSIRQSRMQGLRETAQGATRGDRLTHRPKQHSVAGGPSARMANDESAERNRLEAEEAREGAEDGREVAEHDRGANEPLPRRRDR